MRIIKALWRKWRKLAIRAGNFQALIIFKLFYFVILWTVGIFITLFSDPLRLKKTKLKTNFVPWDHPEETLEQARKSY